MVSIRNGEKIVTGMIKLGEPFGLMEQYFQMYLKQSSWETAFCFQMMRPLLTHVAPLCEPGKGTPVLGRMHVCTRDLDCSGVQAGPPSWDTDYTSRYPYVLQTIPWKMEATLKSKVN